MFEWYFTKDDVHVEVRNSAWWCTLVIPILGRPKQEDCEFEAIPAT
jgi:hypothetical protein